MKNASARLLALILGIWLLTSGWHAAAQVPRKLNYQGLLNNATGQPLDVPAGLPMTFKLYSALNGGVALYAESQSVPVIKGVFSAVIGAAMPLTLAFDLPYFLEVTVNGETLAPRQPMASSAYALRSGCIPRDRVSCFDSPSGEPGLDSCQPGVRTCNAEGTGWSACVGQVVPEPGCGAVCCASPQTCGGAGIPGVCGFPAGSCGVAGDCPPTGNVCVVPTCTGNSCGSIFAPTGVPAGSQVAGNCSTSVCDGSGNLVNQPDNSDVPPPMVCMTPMCTAGIPSYLAQAAGTACIKDGGGGGTCDGAGGCN